MAGRPRAAAWRVRVDRYPYLHDGMRLLDAATSSGRPSWALLGSQLLAASLAARWRGSAQGDRLVRRGHSAGRPRRRAVRRGTACLRRLPLARDASRCRRGGSLAASALTPLQASAGPARLGVQFHLETTRRCSAPCSIPAPTSSGRRGRRHCIRATAAHSSPGCATSRCGSSALGRPALRRGAACRRRDEPTQ